MERLTQKKENGLYELKAEYQIYGEENGIRLVQIVGQFEDIKEELGINLITLLKALKNGVWGYDRSGAKIYYNRIAIEKDGIIMYKHGIVRDEEYYATFKDYGKLWALRKEELKK